MSAAYKIVGDPVEVKRLLQGRGLSGDVHHGQVISADPHAAQALHELAADCPHLLAIEPAIPIRRHRPQTNKMLAKSAGTRAK